jgi:hypothetical protein
MARADPAVALVSVVGPVEGYLLDAFLDHYLSLGVSEVLLALHLGPELGQDKEKELLAQTRDRAEVVEIDRGPWRAEMNPSLFKELRSRCRAEWHVIADSDEFQYYRGTLQDRAAKLERSSRVAATGLFWDRITPEGELRHPRPGESLDQAYSRGAFISPILLDADPRKITLARRDVELSWGNHHARAVAPELIAEPPMPVHHFKWRGDCIDYLRGRITQFAGSPHRVEMSGCDEAQEAVALFDDQGRLRGALPPATCPRPTVLSRLPRGWRDIATPIWRYWQYERWVGVEEWWEAKRRPPGELEHQ